MRVLLIDTDGSLAAAVAECGGVQVVVCPSPSDAIRILADDHFDAVITDLRGLDSWPRVAIDTPVIAILDDPGEAGRAVSSGASEYLMREDCHSVCLGCCVWRARVRVDSGLTVQRQLIAAVREQMEQLDVSLDRCSSRCPLPNLPG